jgi:hypothetical protein
MEVVIENAGLTNWASISEIQATTSNMICKGCVNEKLFPLPRFSRSNPDDII